MDKVIRPKFYRYNPNIELLNKLDIMKEMELIKQKKSKLSATMRRLVEKNYNEILAIRARRAEALNEK